MIRTNKSGVRAAFSMVTLDRLRSFHTVVDAGGFARAAPGDPSRQSQLNRQVRELGKALGVDLMERRGRGVAATSAGLRLRAVVVALFEGLREVADDARDAPVDLTLAAGDSLLQWLVLPRLGAATAPRVRFTLVATSNATEDVASGRAHFGLSRDREFPPAVTHLDLGKLAFTLFVPRRMFRADAPLPELLAKLPLVRVTGDPVAFDEFVGRSRASVTVALSCETFPQAARAVASGRYAALLPAIAVTELTPAIAIAVSVKAPDVESARVALIARPRIFEARPEVAPAYKALGAGLRAGLGRA